MTQAHSPLQPAAVRLSPKGMTAAPLPLRKLALRGLAAGLLLGGLGAVTFGATAGAQALAGFNTNQPVSFDADRIELQDRQNRGVLSGGVIITQGDLRLSADRITIAYSDAGPLTIQRLDATGNVVVTRGAERASGSAGIYDFNRKVILLSGGVNLRRGSDSLSGGRLTIDLNSGLSSVDGNAGGTSSTGNGRVSGTFAVPQQ